ncbi:MAG: zinc ribbon domain-containing protein [Opitutales bacterium]|nr:zinc ribbon domain-containing protein [Opitutales bacterium]
MPTYEYETIPSDPSQKPQRFEVRQCMSDEPLSVHPETGERVRRVYTTFNVTGSSSSDSDSCCDTGHKHGGSCGCGCCGL